ncbi:MAG: hypothetical protein AVDCRST_MAG23-2172, partial [uncultured Sphingosinicella sp.]
ALRSRRHPALDHGPFRLCPGGRWPLDAHQAARHQEGRADAALRRRSARQRRDMDCSGEL